MSTIKRKPYLKPFLTLCCLFILASLFYSCTTFRAGINPETQQWQVYDNGGFLVGRQSTFSIKHSFLGEDNVLHEYWITRNSDEKVDAQERLIQMLMEMSAQNYALKANIAK